MLRSLLYATVLTVTLTYSAISLPVIAANPVSATITSVQEKTAIALPTGFQYPNGIARASNGALYVGSVTSGRILEIQPDGSIKIFFPGNDEIFASTSLRLDEQRGILWGTSPDFLGIPNSSGEIVRRPHRIFAIHVRTGKVLRVIPMPNRGFGNDMALDVNGGVYVTDSAHPRIYYLSPGDRQLQLWAEDDRLRAKLPGLAGIARTDDGVLVVNLFSDGKLFKLTMQPKGKLVVEEISLNCPIENPDGMQFAPDGSLILLEGAIASGNGRLLRIRNILTTEPEPKVLEVLAEKLESPANLTIVGQEILVTEARIRHRLLPRREREIPNLFFIRRFTLQE